MKLIYFIKLFIYIAISAVFTYGHPLSELNREIRSHHKKPLFGGLFNNGHPGITNNNYLTNINNYGHGGSGGPGYVGHGGSYAGSAAFAGGFGGNQAQSQSAAFSFGPFSAAFSQSQSEGHKGRFFDYFDY